MLQLVLKLIWVVLFVFPVFVLFTAADPDTLLQPEVKVTVNLLPHVSRAIIKVVTTLKCLTGFSVVHTQISVSLLRVVMHFSLMLGILQSLIHVGTLCL